MKLKSARTRARFVLLLLTSVTVLGIYAVHSSFLVRYADVAGIKAEEKLPSGAFPWMNNSTVMIERIKGGVKCEVLHLGCFTRSLRGEKVKVYHKISLPNDNTSRRTLSACFSKCFESQCIFAGFREANHICYCGRTFRGFLIAPNMTADTSMDLAGECTNPLSLRVYRKNRDCEKGISEDFMERRMVAYSAIPRTLNGRMLAFTGSNLTSQQCFLNCESRGFSIAMPILRSSACVCSDLFSMFRSPERMQQAMHMSRDGNKDWIGYFSAPAYQTLVREHQCEPPRFLSHGTRGRTVLASFPGSGNTWVRHLIELATGYYTGSQYTDEGLVNGGFVGEALVTTKGPSRVIATKDHFFGFRVPSYYTSAILLVRNPYNAKLSEFIRRKAESHTGLIKASNYKTEDFSRFVMSNLGVWYKISETVLRKIKSVLVVYYEDVVDDPVREMRRIVVFLSKSLTGENFGDVEQRLMCMNLDLRGNFKRPRRRKLKYNPFNSFMMDMIDRSIRDYDRLVKKHHQPARPQNYLHCKGCYNRTQ